MTTDEVEVTLYMVILGDIHSTLFGLFGNNVGKRFRDRTLRPDF